MGSLRSEEVALFGELPGPSCHLSPCKWQTTACNMQGLWLFSGDTNPQAIPKSSLGLGLLMHALQLCLLCGFGASSVHPVSLQLVKYLWCTVEEILPAWILEGNIFIQTVRSLTKVLVEIVRIVLLACIATVKGIYETWWKYSLSSPNMIIATQKTSKDSFNHYEDGN